MNTYTYSLFVDDSVQANIAMGCRGNGVRQKMTIMLISAFIKYLNAL